jgi:hypothetical protein
LGVGERRAVRRRVDIVWFVAFEEEERRWLGFWFWWKDAC